MTDNRDTFNHAVPFKVINDATCEIVGHFSSEGAALAYAREQHKETGGHFKTYQVKWLTSTLSYADLNRRVAK